MKLFKWLSLVLCFSCIDMIVQEDHYNSLYFQGGSWIEFPTFENMKMGTSANDYTLQFWVSGGEFDFNNAPAFFSIVDSRNRTKLSSSRDQGNNKSIRTIVNDVIKIDNENTELDWINPDNFNLISFLFSSDNMDLTIYINNNKIGPLGDAGKIDVGDASLIFGARANKEYNVLENFWYGYIDEIRLWNTWLADSTIKFQADHPSKFGKYYRYTDADGEEIATYLDSLIGLWRFNFSELTATVIDESDHGHDGTIYTYPDSNYTIELSGRGVQ